MSPKAKPEIEVAPPETAQAGEGSKPDANMMALGSDTKPAFENVPVFTGAATTATVLVRGPAKGRWRIGRHFGPEPVAIPEADLTPEQKEALASDPELMIQLVDPEY